MGTNDGTVKYNDLNTKWLTNPINPNGYNVAIFGDGYADGDANFSSDADLLIKLIKMDAPFGELWGAFNFYQVIVASNNSGVSTENVTKKTYFDSKITGGGTAASCDLDILLTEVQKFRDKYRCRILIMQL